jgi:hypothetical protein
MFTIKKTGLLLGAIGLFSLPQAFAIGGKNFVSTSAEKGAFELSVPGKKTALCIAAEDYPGVLRALKDLRTDIGKVTGLEPTLSTNKTLPNTQNVLVGTLGKSKLIDGLVKSRKIDVTPIKGKWENYLIQVVENPLPGLDRALVVVGSDKRGTIYGIYEISEKIGVSPWYWWADVPIAHRDRLYVLPGKVVEGPSVKYRGIFINDEAPALSGWIHEKFGDVPQGGLIGRGVANYGHEFYTRVFELLLRIKANYLWPAMWGNAFNEDDPENPRLADEYGIVMGTSHQEPMVRSQQEWDRRNYRTLGPWDYVKHPQEMQDFWREGIRRNKDYESVVTMGLRGANDSEMKGTMKDNIAMVEGIIKTQQQILVDEMKKPLESIPQAWCLYKEINDYYNEGMKVPDNITLLWADDNWGYIRRLPDEKERLRKGGAGVYYHFDYHGGPRSYEWINTNPLPKIWEQMSLAKQYGADQIWVVNVGHFKGYELPMEYFMDLGWNTNRWTNDNITDYTRQWAAREFGARYADGIAEILSKYGKYNARRKPESLTPRTYSLVNYNEAETVVSDYNALVTKAETIGAQLPKEYQDAFYQLVWFPTKACAVLNEMYVTAAKNQLYARQGRASAAAYATQAKALFSADTALMTHYNKVFANGRWNHFMDQTFIGYTSWNPPRRNSISGLRLVEAPVITDSIGLGVALEGSEEAWPGTSTEAVLPEFDPFGGKTHWMDVFNRGKSEVAFTVQCSVPWLTISETSGTLGAADKRLRLSLDEEKMPEGKQTGVLTVRGGGKTVTVKVQGFKPSPMEMPYVKGFIESNKTVSIEPEHFEANKAQGSRLWMRVDDYGLNLSGMRATAQANAPAAVPGKDAPCLEYSVYLFSTDSIEVNLITSPVLNFMPGRDIRVAVSMNDEAPRYLTVVPASFSAQKTPSWGDGVLNQCRRLTTTLKFANPGPQTLKVWMVDPGVVLQKIVLGSFKPSYLGPAESVNLK